MGKERMAETEAQRQMREGLAARDSGDTTTPSKTPGADKLPPKNDDDTLWSKWLRNRTGANKPLKEKQVQQNSEEEVLGKLAASRKVRYLPGSEGTADYYLTPTDTTNTENLIKVNATSRTNPEGKNK
jgi:hypothetical protein